MKSINWKKLFICILVTFIIGSLFAFFTINSSYDSLNKPFEIPAIVFPIVWSILYILMAISLYIVTDYDNSENAVIIYFLQLIVNSFWTLFFFGLKWYLFSFLWIILLIILVVIMIYKFYKINKTAGFINIFYLLWLIFAGYLNFMIYYLN